MFIGFMAITHAAIAAAGTCLILSTADPVTIGLAIAGSQLPDLDTSSSSIGQIFFPISNWIEDRFPHRSVTHSLLATVVIAAVALPIGYFFFGNITSAIALPLGHLLSCFSDAFTKQGVQLFWPDPAWAISVSNPNRRFTTGGTGEYSVLAGATALLIFGIWIANSGGATMQVSQTLGLKDGLVAVYNENGSTNHVWANIQGVQASDRSLADGRYLIVAYEQSEFILTNGKGIYKTDDQIIANKLTTSVGEEATTKIETIDFDDEDVVPKLQQLMTTYPDAAIFISGQLAVDFPEEIKIDLDPHQLTTIDLTGGTVNMKYHPITQALGHFYDQYAIGTITAKIIQPKPEDF